MFWLLVAIAALLGFTYLVLRGENLAYLDQPLPPAVPHEPGAAYSRVLGELQAFSAASLGRGRERIVSIRRFMDEMPAGGEYASEIRSVDVGEVRGEWVLAPDHDPARRILYIHGGAFLPAAPSATDRSRIAWRG
jgi:monoterpene epsilon-lactone hydrolase